MYQFVKIWMEDEIKAAREEGSMSANIKTAKRMLKRGVLSNLEIAEDAGLSVEQVEQLAEEVKSDMQPV